MPNEAASFPGAPQHSHRLQAVLSNLWVKLVASLPGRLAPLRRAAAELAAGGPLTDDTRAEAELAAHRLTGALGTFGCLEEAAVCRHMEALLTQAHEPPVARGAVLRELVRQVEARVQARAGTAEGAQEVPAEAAQGGRP